jgi:hypothetical protein
MTKRALIPSAMALIAICALPALAEEPFIDGLPAEQFNRMIAIQNALASVSDADTARGVYLASTVWPPRYRKLKVCFFGGTDEARKLIADEAMDWMRKDIGISLDFGEQGSRTCGNDNDTKMHVRVGFDERGYWSALGQESVDDGFFPQNTKSMNLQGFENTTAETRTPEFYRKVHHEFGHALGLGHEHQNPKSGCEEEYNWVRIYQLLGGDPNYWPKRQIDSNIRQYRYDDTVASDFNTGSVMIYQFPPEFYKSGIQAKCYIEKLNSEISEGDLAELASMYPINDSARVEKFEKSKANFEALWNKLDESKKASISFNPLKSLFQ